MAEPEPKGIAEVLRDMAKMRWAIAYEWDAELNAGADEIERLEGRVAALSRALSSSRAQWIHSINAKRCLEALGENPYDPNVIAEVRGAEDPAPVCQFCGNELREPGTTLCPVRETHAR